MKTALVCGAGGFIGSHLVPRLKVEGFWVRGVDLKFPEFSATVADDFVMGDLRDAGFCRSVVDRSFDEVYQLAADMGGAGYIFTGEHDAEVMHNSASINLNMADTCWRRNVKRIFYASSACMYPDYNQLDPANPKTSEDSAYPAAPDSEYGWEKLFSERLYPGVCPQSRTDRAYCALSQYLRAGRYLAGWTRKSAIGDLPQGRGSDRRRRDRDMGGWLADAVVSVH